MPLLLPLVGQKGDEWIQWKALTAISWGFRRFCEVKRAIFRILGLFLGIVGYIYIYIYVYIYIYMYI